MEQYVGGGVTEAFHQIKHEIFAAHPTSGDASSFQTHVMIAEDPQARVGSGGATLNALLLVTEYLSALQGHTVVNADCLRNARILILHLVGSLIGAGYGR